MKSLVLFASHLTGIQEVGKGTGGPQETKCRMRPGECGYLQSHCFWAAQGVHCSISDETEDIGWKNRA